MDNTYPNEQARESKQSFGKILKESVSDASRVLNNTREQVIGTPKQVILGATITTCLAFLIALAGMSRLDAQLTIAGVAMGFALPFLMIGFLLATLDYGPGCLDSSSM